MPPRTETVSEQSRPKEHALVPAREYTQQSSSDESSDHQEPPVYVKVKHRRATMTTLGLQQREYETIQEVGSRFAWQVMLLSCR